MAFKKVKEMKEECCVTCAHLLECAEVAGAKCRNYKPREIDKETVSTRYIEILNQMAVLTNELAVVETELKIAEKVALIKPKEPEIPALTARNKKIVKLLEQGVSVEEIAKQLKLDPKTVAKEIGYLTKIRALNNKTLVKKGDKVAVLATA